MLKPKTTIDVLESKNIKFVLMSKGMAYLIKNNNYYNITRKTLLNIKWV